MLSMVSCQCPHEGCQWAFTTSYKLKRHIRGHTGEKPFLVSSSITERGRGNLFVLLLKQNSSVVFTHWIFVRLLNNNNNFFFNFSSISPLDNNNYNNYISLLYNNYIIILLIII